MIMMKMYNIQRGAYIEESFTNQRLTKIKIYW